MDLVDRTNMLKDINELLEDASRYARYVFHPAAARTYDALVEAVHELRAERDGAMDTIATREMEIAELRAKLEQLHTMSTVEMMCENENVNVHVREWEARCLKAEAKLDAQQTIIDAFGSGVDGVHLMATEIIEGRKLKAKLDKAKKALFEV